MTIWQSISTNFKNGNIAKYTKQLGQTFMQAGMTSAMFDQMTNDWNAKLPKSNECHECSIW